MSAQTSRPSDVRLLDDIVNGLIRQHGITAAELMVEFKGRQILTNEGWNGRVEQIALAKAKMLTPETLGRLIYAIPDADLYGVHCGTWLGKHESGPYLLQQIAASAMVCRVRYALGVDSGVGYFDSHHDGTAA